MYNKNNNYGTLNIGENKTKQNKTTTTTTTTNPPDNKDKY
jgi:hypothetical protein